ncbi:ribonuclease M5 [Microaceticoccus formicicus]|uniref:ribonuclease M5 n=1 Tax=Microaceticoccus formicicus TaxID=3118105 RepID=UPI003CD02D8D|nr:ribonuclease M5 [Peptoniphilaceae bacterium AMB_02]
MKIKEVIVVEGKDDITAVKAALDCEVIATGGSHINAELLKSIANIHERVGIIVLTDPDYSGKKIRRQIQKIAPGCKHAFIRRDDATKDGDIGVENASPEDIRAAIAAAKPEIVEKGIVYSKSDLIDYGLIGMPDSKIRREIFCDILGIGYCNGKQLLKRLTAFNISPEEFEKAGDEMCERVDG